MLHDLLSLGIYWGNYLSGMAYYAKIWIMYVVEFSETEKSKKIQETFLEKSSQSKRRWSRDYTTSAMKIADDKSAGYFQQLVRFLNMLSVYWVYANISPAKIR